MKLKDNWQQDFPGIDHEIIYHQLDQKQKYPTPLILGGFSEVQIELSWKILRKRGYIAQVKQRRRYFEEDGGAVTMFIETYEVQSSGRKLFIELRPVYREKRLQA